ncbi:beta-ketoacyl-[acyl-carrier-protein] synthase family protein [Mitsuaria sp. WAJ17]|uniref:beta-ketoacyl-[acyl-carrier-protein] synthase family protein n=1 Tax=Mitsuaria sp. WAJ17 TaxID=2761452 RepID=UPI001602662B|nr:beta-ketoacyl-[acyl-carrier-protein] synthase family protein [Mitsuaria sp. WAJ17]MBB2485696.1 beta-ketoacyl-[acyl-carrier-protein] synthase family protein [Mitsuaria sp. WAJ17]
MNRAAAVTGIGLISPAGRGIDDSLARILSGRSVASFDQKLADLPVRISCQAPDTDLAEFGIENAWQWDRYSQFAAVAAADALADAGLRPHMWADESRVAVVIGSGAGGTATLEEQHAALLEDGPNGVSSSTLPMGLLNMAAGKVAMYAGARGPCFAPCSACASGASAIGIGRELIRSGVADIVIAGGAEAPITPLYVSAFARMRTLSRCVDPDTASRPFDANRDGFVIGEGAGILVLESVEHAMARGARVRSLLIGYGASADAHHVTNPHPDGRGAKLAMQGALRDAGISAGSVNYINAHGTSTIGNDVIEAAAIHSVFGEKVAVSSTKGVTGHLLGAAGAIEAAFTALTIQHGVIPPTANLKKPDSSISIDLVRGEARSSRVQYALSNSFGFGGQNVSLLFAEHATL